MKALSGVELIAAERQRQIDKFRYTALSDDHYSKPELVLAAISYACVVARPDTEAEGRMEHTRAANDWPWPPMSWNPSNDPVRNLVKAGALIAAEIDRLQRLKSKQKTENEREAKISP